MGSTLTNTQPKDTYKSLLKTSDSTELSGTAKYVSDGNGNDSALALSTSAVGIGTTSPDGKLDVASAGNLVSTGAFANPHLSLTASASLVDNDSFVGITYATSDAVNYGWSMGAKRESGGNGYFEIRQHFNSATGTQIARFTGNGLCFGSDTAAANALDDYEAGTFTPTFQPTVGGFTSITYSNQYGKYTKIGNRVDINLQITCSSVSLGTAGGVLSIGGLPYTVGAKICPASLLFVSNWPTGVFPVRAGFNDGATNILLRFVTALNANETYLAGTDIQASSSITISGTYFV